MAITKEQKAEMLEMLRDKFSTMTSAVFVQYRGMTVASLSKLRSQLREKNFELYVVKKTLLKKVAGESKIEDYDSDMLTGPVAVAFSQADQVEIAKILKKFTKEDEKLEIVAGILDKKMINAAKVSDLAMLPSREELLAKLVGSLSAPISGFVRSINAPLTGFVQVLRTLGQKNA